MIVNRNTGRLSASHVTTLVLCTFLAGCATPGYVEYTHAMAIQAQANADAKARTTAAILAMANNGDATTKTVAVMLLAMQNNVQTLPVEPPRDQALQWAAVVMPSITALAGGYFGYRLGIIQSNNQAVTTQSSYGTIGQVALGGFGSNSLIAGAGFSAIPQPLPVDWSGISNALKPNIITTVTNTSGGDGILGSGTITKPVTTTTDNSTRPVVVVPPVVVPPIVTPQGT